MDDNGLTHQIIGLAMRVHTRLGPGLLESAYEACLCHELIRDALPFARQVDLPLDYDGVHLDCGYRADLIVDRRMLLELKSVECIQAGARGTIANISSDKRLSHRFAAELQYAVSEGWNSTPDCLRPGKINRTQSCTECNSVSG